MGDAGLGDVTIGVLTPLFGTAPEDEEVARIVRDALEDMRVARRRDRRGAVPGLDELLQDTSVINAEFKFDLLDFLAKYPGGAGALARRDPRRAASIIRRSRRC